MTNLPPEPDFPHWAVPGTPACNGESQALLGTTAGVGWGARGAVSILPALLWTSSTPLLGSLPPSARQRNRRVFIAQSRKLRHREISLTGLRTLARAVSDGYVANWNAGVLQGLNPRSAMWPWGVKSPDLSKSVSLSVKPGTYIYLTDGCNGSESTRHKSEAEKLLNSDYSIILVESQIPLLSLTPCCSSEKHHFYLYVTWTSFTFISPSNSFLK